MDIDFFRTNLLIETKSFGGIWSFEENAMGLYMGGRQIFETSQEGSSLSMRLSENMPRRCAIPRDSPKFFKILKN
jgi:hypothetical protein